MSVEGLVKRVGDCRGDLGDWVGLAVGEKLAGWRLHVGLEMYRKQDFIILMGEMTGGRLLTLETADWRSVGMLAELAEVGLGRTVGRLVVEREVLDCAELAST